MEGVCIEYKTEELNAQLAAQRQEIGGLNAELVKLETRGTVEYAAQLDSKLRLKQKDLEAHEANKPVVVEQPNNPTAAGGECADRGRVRQIPGHACGD
jgi:uncharacterized coiled-coil protein SlyX